MLGDRKIGAPVDLVPLFDLARFLLETTTSATDMADEVVRIGLGVLLLLIPLSRGFFDKEYDESDHSRR